MKKIKEFFLIDGSTKCVVKYFLLSRISLLLLGYFTINEFALHGVGRGAGWQLHSSIWLHMWGMWDTGWYLDIAKNWYPHIQSLGGSGDCGACNFFPLYPALIFILNYLMGIDHFVSGIIISNISLFFTGIILYKIVLHLYGTQQMAKDSTLFLFLFPASFILSGVFTESLYLFLILLCIYAALKNNWLLAGVCGFFLSLTRAIGIFVIIPLLIEYLKQKNYKLTSIKPDVLLLLLIPCGVCFFLYQNYLSTGDAVYFIHNPHWLYNPLNPVKNLWDGLTNSFFTWKFLGIYTLIVILFAIVFYKSISASLNLINFYSILIPLAYGIVSMPRMTLVSFPLMIQLAYASNKWNARTAVIIILMMTQTYFAVCWFLGFGNIV